MGTTSEPTNRATRRNQAPRTAGAARPATRRLGLGLVMSAVVIAAPLALTRHPGPSAGRLVAGTGASGAAAGTPIPTTVPPGGLEARALGVVFGGNADTVSIQGVGVPTPAYPGNSGAAAPGPTPTPDAAPTSVSAPATAKTAVASPPTTTTTAPRPTTTTTQPRPTPTTQPPTTTAPANSANSETGQASWYDAPAGTCAHPSLPFGTVVTVTNLANGASTTCTVEDRGPYAGGRIIDLSESTFSQIADPSEGVIQVRIQW